MEEYGGVWRSMEDYGGVWRSIEEYGGVWRSMEEYGRIWRIMEEYGRAGQNRTEQYLPEDYGVVEICPEKELNKGEEFSGSARRGGRSRILCDGDRLTQNPEFLDKYALGTYKPF